MFLRFLVVDHRVKFFHFAPESARGGGGHHLCNGLVAVGASGAVSVRILAARKGCVGAVLAAVDGTFFEAATFGPRRHAVGTA